MMDATCSHPSKSVLLCSLAFVENENENKINYEKT